MQGSIEGAQAQLSSRLEIAQQISGRLDEYSSAIAAKQALLNQSEAEMAKLRLTEDEKASLRLIDLNSSHGDLIGPLRRLLEIRAHPLAQTAEVAQILQDTHDKVVAWFERNISTIDLESVSPSISLLAEFIAESQGSDWFRSRYAEQRSAIQLKSFGVALSVGGRARPIEMHGHSPIRYISDMAAWVHGAFESEMDLLDLLLSSQSAVDKRALAGQIMAGCAEEFAARTRVSVAAMPTIAGAFGVQLLIGYYQDVFKTLLDLSGLVRCCAAQIDALLEPLAGGIAREHIDSKTQTPPPSLELCLEQLAEVHRVHQTSLGPGQDDGAFDALKDRLYGLVLSGVTRSESDIYRLNCIAALQLRVEPIAGPLLALEADLVAALSQRLVEGRLFRAAMIQQGTALDASLSEREANDVLRNLSETFVIHSGWDWLKDEVRLTSPRHRQLVADAATAAVLGFYDRVYSQIPAGPLDPAIKSPDTIKLMFVV